MRRLLCCFVCLILCSPAFAQSELELEQIDPDEWLPGSIDPSEDVHGVLGLEFGMTHEEVIDAMVKQGCSLVYEDVSSEYNLIALGFDGYTYEGITGLRVTVNLTADKDYLYVVIITLYYGDEVSKEKVQDINEANIRNFGISLYSVEEIERYGLFGSHKKSRISDYYIIRTDDTGRILYGKFLYQVEESDTDFTFSFWGFLD